MRRRLGLLGSILSVLVLAASCAGPSVSLPFVRQSVLTPQQARSTFLRLESERTLAIHDRDPKALSKIETGQALTNDRGEIASAANGYDDDGEGGPFTAVSILVPRSTAYPVWFAAETRSAVERGLDVLSQRRPGAPWTIRFESVFYGNSAPAVARSGGYAVPATIERNLSADLANYYENGITHAPTQFVLPGRLTSEEVSGYLKTISSYEDSGWSYGFTFIRGAFDRGEGLSLAGGGSLGFATYTVTYSIAVHGGGCFVEDPTSPQGWSSIGSRAMVSALNVMDIVGALVVETRKGDRVIGQDFDEFHVDRQAC